MMCGVAGEDGQPSPYADFSSVAQPFLAVPLPLWWPPSGGHLWCLWKAAAQLPLSCLGESILGFS